MNRDPKEASRDGAVIVSIRALTALAALAVLPAWPGRLSAQPVADETTLLLLQFEPEARGDFGRGATAVAFLPAGADFVPGRFGQALQMRDRQRVSLDGSLPKMPAGTIDFWMKPDWPGDDPQRHAIFHASYGPQCYVTVNTLGKGRLGMAVSGLDPEGQSRWRRVDGDISGWKPGQWHHVAFTWGEGRLRVVLDGQESPKQVDDACMPAKPFDEATLQGFAGAIDGFRIRRSEAGAEDVQRWIRQADDPPYRHLEELAWQPPEAAQANRIRLPNRAHVPLLIGQRAYRTGLASVPGGKVHFAMDHAYEALEVDVGASSLGSPDAACRLRIVGDGKTLFESAPMKPGEAPRAVRADLKGVRQLVLETDLVGDKARLHGIWGNPILLRNGADKTRLPGEPIAEKDLEMYRRQQASDDFQFTPPAGKPFFIVRKFWEDEIDPACAPDQAQIGAPLEAFATPGEYEPVNCVVYSVAGLRRLEVTATALRCGDTELPAGALDVRWVLRSLERDLYTLPPNRSTVTSRFLLANEPIDVPAGTLREYHVTIHVPSDARPGRYVGKLAFQSADQPSQEVPVILEVLPFRFRPLVRKFYGMYYRFSPEPGPTPWARTERELDDLREHGAISVKSDLGIVYDRKAQPPKPDFEEMKTGLDLLRKHGFHGPLPVTSGAQQAAAALGYNPIKDYDDQPRREAFYKLVKTGLEGLVALNRQYPEFEFLPTHMDEVLTQDRLDLYIRLTEAVRQVPSLRMYITMHNTPRDLVEAMTERIDPFVDVRCYNGHAMDSWIQADHSFNELAEQLARSGDEAWMYYNIRGSFFRPEWMRLANGFYMWISPIRGHFPWMYYRYHGNPLDDLDGPAAKAHDFVFGVPDPEAPTRMISTRHWEAYREGIDDMCYLSTLEDLIAEHAADPAARQAQAWLDELRAILIAPPDQLKAIDKESPIMIWLSERYDGAKHRQVRRRAAEFIERLSRPAGG